MYSEFKDNIVLVTGGNSGIGKATAFAFADWGAKVIITGRNAQKGEAVALEATEREYQMEFVQVDSVDPVAVKEMIDYIVEKYGRLDVAFNNAGVAGEMGKTVETTIENWQHVMNVNLNGVFYCMKYEIEAMLETGGGAIINNASVSGHKGYAGSPSYVASKHGLIGLTKSSAMGYAKDNIRINGVSPGLIKTPMTDEDRDRIPNYDEWVERVEPIGRIGTPEEVASAVLWLASAQSSFVTGHILAVDGGVLAC